MADELAVVVVVVVVVIAAAAVAVSEAAENALAVSFFNVVVFKLCNSS